MHISFTRIVAIVLFMSLYACIEGYLFLRVLGQAHSRGRGAAKTTGRKNLLWVYWPLSLLVAGLYFYHCYSSGSFRSLFSLASSYWGLFFLFPFFLLADILSFGGLIFRIIRNRKLCYYLWVRTASIVLAGGVLVFGSLSARYPTITDYSVTVEKPLPQNGLKVILISDLHIGSMMHKKQLKRLVSQINALEGDMVLIAGDIIDRSLAVFKAENLNEDFMAIKAPLGVYAAMGNHDYFGGNPEELRKQLAAVGVRLLVDEAVLVNGVYVIGRNDYNSGRWRVKNKPLKDLTENLDPSLPFIVIDHQPVYLTEAEAAGIDLQVSGHTHHGQIWPGPIFTKRLFEHDYGLYYKGKTAIVVTSGCGTWGPPLRIGTKSEIVCIELKNGN